MDKNMIFPHTEWFIEKCPGFCSCNVLQNKQMVAKVMPKLCSVGFKDTTHIGDGVE